MSRIRRILQSRLKNKKEKKKKKEYTPEEKRRVRTYIAKKLDKYV